MFKTRFSGMRRTWLFQVFMLLLLTLLVLLAYWQRSASLHHRDAWAALWRIQQAANDGQRAPVTGQEAIDLLSSSRVVGPASGKQLHVWRAPFRNYYIRLHLSRDDEVLMIDRQTAMTATSSPLPTDRSNSPEVLAAKRMDEKLELAEQFVEKAELINEVVASADGLQRVKEWLESENGKHLPASLGPTRQTEFIRRRQQWYTALWVESFQEYSSADLEWKDLAQEFLVAAADKAGRYGIKNMSGKHDALAQQLLENDCNDPLVKAVAMGCQLNGKVISWRRLVEEFMASDYPAEVAYFAGFPFVNASQVAQLQVLHTPVDEPVQHNLLALEDPLEMRVVYEHISQHYNRGYADSRQSMRPQRVLATQSPSPWLKYMLLSLYSSSGNAKLVALFNAWYELPENPEAPTLIMDASWNQKYRYGSPITFAGEDERFWFQQAVAGQFDYLPAYSAYMSFHPGLDFGIDCAATERFDTDVPIQFLSSLRRTASAVYGDWKTPKHVRFQNMFSWPEAHQTLVKLSRGYSKHPTFHPLLRNYLVCSSFYNGRFEVARNRLNLLRDTVDLQVFDYCGLTVGRILAAASAEQHQPFDSGLYGDVLELAFSERGKSLLCMHENGQILRCDVSTGDFTLLYDGEKEELAPIYFPQDNDATIAVASRSSGKITLRTDDFAVVDELDVSSSKTSTFFTKGSSEYWTSVPATVGPAGQEIRLHLATDGKVFARIPTHYEEFHRIVVSDDASAVLVAAISFENDAGMKPMEILVYDLDARSWRLKARMFSRRYGEIAISPDGSSAAISGADRAGIVNTEAVSLNEYSVKIIHDDEVENYVKLPHPVPVTCVQFLGDEWIATGCYDGVVRIWSCESGDLVAKLLGHTNSITSIDFLPADRLLATAGRDGQIQLWDVAVPQDEVRLQYLRSSIPFGGLQNLYVDPGTRDIVTDSRIEGSIRWHADSQYRRFERVASEELAWTTNVDGYVIDRTASPDDPESVVLQVRELESGQKFPKIKERSTAGAVFGILTEDIRSIVTSGDVCVVRDIPTGKAWPWGVVHGHRGPVSGMATRGRRLATLSSSPDVQVRIWELPEDPAGADVQLRLVTEYAASLSNEGQSIQLSPDGGLLVIADGLSYSHFWDIEMQQLRGTLKGQQVAFSPTSSQFAINDNNFRILVCDTETLDVVQHFDTIGGGPRFLQWGPRGEMLYFAAANCVHAVDVATGAYRLPVIGDAADPKALDRR